jgi:hypothetical protein
MGPGADSSRDRKCGRTRVGRGLVGNGADSRRRRVGPGADYGRTRVERKHRLMGAGGRTGREYDILARTEGDSRAAIAMGTRVWARTGARTGAGPNRRMLQGRRAHAATGAGGINYPSNNIFFANLFSRSAPCPSTPNALCKELWCGRLALKLVGGGFVCLLSFR